MQTTQDKKYTNVSNSRKEKPCMKQSQKHKFINCIRKQNVKLYLKIQNP